ncbi:hypothetical protein [Pendulispora albinea]|uniref:Uncharacterized protein n=1 Tax=Pendulispora albinea TaxID=2741071 RepID=A0ABZ2LPV8_9BACT
MTHDRRTQASALRWLAERIEESDADLSDDERVMGTVAHIVALMKLDEAVRDWHEREAAGEKTLSSAEVRRMLGM